MCSEFDDIRPYYDSEIGEAMRQLADWEYFAQAMRFIYPDVDIEQARRRMLGIASTQEFQATFMTDTINRIVAETTDGFTWAGLQHLKPKSAYMFVSNHRDITLDAFLLQHVLLQQRGQTSYVVFGQNLLAMPAIEVLFRANKLIRMERGGTPRAFYRSLLHLSTYINHLLQEGQSVWIAQKNGRAKDGRDVTAPAMLKMLVMGSGLPPQKALEQLHIVPISVSYEWDPCDAMKAAELYNTHEGIYHKAPDEDTKSVVTGIIGQKGHVHLEICKPLTRRELQPAEGEDLFEHVARQIDHRIQGAYRLMPTNHAAYSMLGGRTASGRYGEQTMARLRQRVEALPNGEMQRLMLEAYAAPVQAQAQLQKRSAKSSR